MDNGFAVTSSPGDSHIDDNHTEGGQAQEHKVQLIISSRHVDTVFCDVGHGKAVPSPVYDQSGICSKQRQWTCTD